MDSQDRPTETDARIAENQAAAPITGIAGHDGTPLDPGTGLPQGMHDDDHSPLTLGDVAEPPR